MDKEKDVDAAGNAAVCCVCDRPIEGGVRTIGKRFYCATHYERVTRENRAAARPLFVTVAGVVVFVAAVAVLAPALRPRFEGAALVGIGVLLALVPGALWLIAFYRQDRLEPEPKRYVLAVVLLGALLAQGIGQPVIRDLFRVQNWLGADLITTLLGSILVVGVLQEFLKYAAVRYTVFEAAEFDERVDGIIYSAAAGLGYATVLNVQYVVGNGGVDLEAGAIHIAVTALAQGSFSGVVGYFLGRAKFESMGAFWLPSGLTVAAALNGLVTFALDEVAALDSWGANPYYGLVAATAVAGATFVALFAVIRRLNATLASSE